MGADHMRGGQVHLAQQQLLPLRLGGEACGTRAEGTAVGALRWVPAVFQWHLLMRT